MEFVAEKKYKSVYKTYLVYFIALTCFVVVRIASSLGLFGSLSSNLADIIYSVIIEVFCLFLIPLILYKNFLGVNYKNVFHTCNFYKMNFRSIIISVALGFFMYFLTLMTSYFFNGIIQMLGYSSGSSVSEKMTTTTYIVQIFTTAILPAFCEEFLHRGILLQGTKHTGFTRAIMISSIMFGLIHLNITQVFYAAILGMIMGYASVIAKNIWPAIIMHFMNNFMSITNSFLIDNNTAYSTAYSNVFGWLTHINFILLVLIIIVAIVAILIITFFLLKALYYNGLVVKVERAISKTYLKDGQAIDDSPIIVNPAEIKDIIENTTTLNIDFVNAKTPLELLMPRQPKIYKQTYKDKIFLKSSIVLGVVITIFTFVWGLM